MTKESKLIKNTIIIAIGSLSTKFITFLLLPFYTALLTTEEYGIVDLITTCIMLCSAIISIQLEQGVFRFLVDSRQNKKEQKEYISTILIFIIIFIISISIICGVILYFINFNYKEFIIINTALGVILGILFQISRGLGDNISYSIGSFLNAILTVIFNIIFIAFLKWNIFGMLLSVSLACIICIFFIYIKCNLNNFVNLKFYNKNKLMQMLKFSIPLVPNTISWWVVNVSDRFIISSLLGTSDNGIYSIANKFSALCNNMSNIFTISWTESASENVNSNKRNEFYSKIMIQSFKFFASMNVCLIVIIPFLFNLMINIDYKPAYEQIPILICGSLFFIIVNMYGGIYTALKLTSQIAKTTIVAAIFNIILNILLIKKIGLYAVSISTFISYFIIMIYRHIDISKIIKIKYKLIDITLFLFIYVLSIYGYYSYNKYIQLAVMISVFIFCFTINYTFIKQIFHNIKFKITNIKNERNINI